MNKVCIVQGEDGRFELEMLSLKKFNQIVKQIDGCKYNVNTKRWTFPEDKKQDVIDDKRCYND